MNHLKVVFLFVAVLAGGISFAQKGPKFGHINSQELLTLMPETKSATASLDSLKNELAKQIKDLEAEYLAKQTKYEADEPKLNDLVKTDRQAELQNLAMRYQNFQQQAEELLQNKYKELLAPIEGKMRKAIEQVAKENGYTYVADTSTGVFLYWEESDNILALVKKKLGL